MTRLDQADAAVPRDMGWWESAQESWSVNVTARYEKLKQAAEQTIESIVRIIVIFLLQTVVIPLALFWALYVIAGSTLRRHRSAA